MNHLSLFTGAGGGELGAILNGWHTVGYVEWDEYCQRVLAQRIKDGILPEAPIFGDVRAFISEGYAEAYQGLVDVISAGFPCQPFSTASRGRRTAKDFWPDTREVIKRVRPSFILAENVSKRAIEDAALDLWADGYHPQIAKVSAADLGADHLRARYWVFAHADLQGELSGAVDAKVAGVPGVCPRVWEGYSSERGMDDGLAYRVDRLKAIGNGQVPAVVRAVWKLMQCDSQAPDPE